jgi:hypothetical protein
VFQLLFPFPKEICFSPAMPQIRIELPLHLRRLILHEAHELALEVAAPVTLAGLLDTLEARYPQLEGTIREHTTKQRRPFLRFFACNEDISHFPPETALPQEVVDGREPLIILGAIAGG